MSKKYNDSDSTDERVKKLVYEEIGELSKDGVNIFQFRTLPIFKDFRIELMEKGYIVHRDNLSTTWVQTK